jgi:serine/threonine protein kinase/tetratricopeptide (TPR) repeat protein
MIGRTLGHYRILKKIGAGAMGEVYCAYDQTLNRNVALKIINPGSLGDVASENNVLREARFASALNDPRICTIYEVGEVDGQHFIVMELVEGRALSSLIPIEGMPAKVVMRYGAQIAAGLAHAHDHGIIHRDVKPSNIVITPVGQLKILDFGLAKEPKSSEVEEATRSTTSEENPGRIVGTLPYMAPETLRGGEANARSDIWSLGVVLYEMCSGQRPFVGRTGYELSSAILRETPAPLPPNTPAGLRIVIGRCLEKEPGHRYQRAGEAQAVLEAVESDASLRSPESAKSSFPAKPKNASRSPDEVRPGHYQVQSRRRPRVLIAGASAVLIVLLLLGATPFAREKLKSWITIERIPQERELAVLAGTMSADDPQGSALEYGLAETLASRLTALAGNHPLQVIPASEVRARRVTTLDQARQEFGVNLGLELSLRRSGEFIRVNYSLVDAKTHHQIRGDTITAKASDPFAIEDKVSDSVVRALELDLQPQERRSLVAHGTDEPAAYDYYLQGRGYLQDSQKRENVDSAIAVFTRALEKDSRYALAFSGLGEAYWRKYEIDKRNEYADQAQAACARALALEGNLAEGHACLGLVYNGTGKYDEAAVQYRRAVDSEPTNDDAIRGLAAAYAKLGRMGEAESTYKAAIAARPNYWGGYNSLGGLYMSQGRYAEAAEIFSRVTALAPDSFRGYSNLGGAYVLLGKYTEAITALEQSIAIRGTVDAYSNLATAYFNLRRYDDAASNYKKAAALDDHNYVVWGNLGDAYYYSGRRHAEAIAVYKKALLLAKARLEVNPRDASVLGDIASYYSVLGNREQALEYLNKAFGQSGYKDPDLLFQAAMVHNQFGETNATLEWLSKALSAGFSATTIADAPALEGLHSNAQFEKMLQHARALKNE